MKVIIPEQQRLGSLAAEETQGLLRDPCLECLDVVPGSAEARDLRQLGLQFSVAIAASIRDLTTTGTPEALTLAGRRVEGLRRLLQENSEQFFSVRTLMRWRFVGPDAEIFRGHDIGEVPALPENIMDSLTLKCPLANDGRTVAQTHRLAFLPGCIDGEPTSLRTFKEFAATKAKARGLQPILCEGMNRVFDESFAREPIDKRGVWVLEYETLAPRTLNRNDAGQISIVNEFKGYRTARAIEHVACMGLVALESDISRVNDRFFGRCEELRDSGSRASFGSLSSVGIMVDPTICDGQADERTGRWIVYT